MKQLVFISVFLLLLSDLQAAYFRNYQVEDGLSHNSVWAVMQDSYGFLWFGTNDGLNRFDGKSFKIYRKKQDDSLSIGNNFIHYLKEDSQNRFFIGTKEGLYLFNPENENFQCIDLNNNMISITPSINALMEDPDGNIWVGCHGQGLFVLNPDLSVKKHYFNTGKPGEIPSNYIWTLEKDYSGNLWIGTASEGLVLFDSKKEVFTKMKDKADAAITDPTVFSLYCDIDNNIWIGTLSEGLYRYNVRSGKISNYMKDTAFSIKSIIEYSDHELIMGSDKGLIRFDRQTENADFINNDMSFDNLTDKSIFSIFKDNEGSFWIGTYFGGVNYFSPAINKFLYFGAADNSSKSIISSFAEDQHSNIWVGSHNYGLTMLGPKNTHPKPSRYNVGYHDIQALLLDNENLYISLYGKGISMLNINTGAINRLPYDLTAVTSMFRTSNGRILFGTEDGAYYIDSPTDRPVKINELIGVPVKGMAEDYNGNLWFACHAKGLFRLSSEGNWTIFSHKPEDPTSLVTDNVNCVFQDSKFRIWVGTEGGGLALFNNKKECFDFVLDERSGLPSNMIYAMLDDTDGNIWVTTGGGLVKIDNDLKTIKTFGYIGDLQQIRYNLRCALRASDNQLYFGGTNGFIAFNPKEISDNMKKPAIIITKFQIFNKEITPQTEASPLKTTIANTKEIILKHNQSTFSFDFAALSFLSPSDNRYAYILDGFDNEWNYVSSNDKAYYMNIPPGEYVFKVKGTNNDGVWSDTVAIKIKIHPPLWLNNFMIVLYVLLFLGLCTYLIRAYNKRIETKNQEKLYKYKTRKEKEIYESKIDFFTNIAHEIRTPLSLIVAPLENVILSGDGNDRTRTNLNIIKHNTNRLLELINQLLDFRKIEDDMFHFNFKQQDVVKIIRDVYNQYKHNADLNNIELTLNIEKEPIHCIVDSEAIYKIISNLVSNAIKYTAHKIDITAKTENDQLIISVEDDGVGIEKLDQAKIFEPFFQVQDNNGQQLRTGSGLGLSLSQSLAEKHGGRITVQSEQGSGSVFTLDIPLRKTNEPDAVAVESTESANEDKNKLPEDLALADSGLKIVIAEDNNELRDFLVDSLTETYTVFAAENGRQALDIIEKENIDVIISDIIMPEMDGLELCNTVKTNPAYSYIPLILLSAKTDTPTKIEGLNKGADVYLEKPFSVEQLKAQINSIIENRNNIRNSFIRSPLQYFKQNKENTENAEFIEKLNAIILENMSDEKFSIDSLSGQFFISRSNFHKKIKNITGMTPNDYIKLIRLNQSAQLLSTGRYKINEVCYLVGFNTPSYFSKCFQEQFGKLPKDFIQEN